jgi:hypothetical protein
VITVTNETVFSTPSSANVPVAIGELHVVPSLLLATLYWPIRPFGESDGGR